MAACVFWNSIDKMGLDVLPSFCLHSWFFAFISHWSRPNESFVDSIESSWCIHEPDGRRDEQNGATHGRPATRQMKATLSKYLPIYWQTIWMLYWCHTLDDKIGGIDPNRSPYNFVLCIYLRMMCFYNTLFFENKSALSSHGCKLHWSTHDLFPKTDINYWYVQKIYR